jgi:hypothetical protein
MMNRLGLAGCLFLVVAVCGFRLDAAERAGAARGPDALMGIWVPDATPRQLLAVDGKSPPFKEAASNLYAQRKRQYDAGDRSFDQTTWCAGPGMPRAMTMPDPFEIRRDGDRLVFIHGWYRWFRTVDMGGPAVEPPLPLTMGFPVGKWEGDTLIIRSVGLIDVTVMDAMGMPHSEELVLTERLRVLADGRLEDRITIEDPETFSKPWETVLTFHRDASARVTDDVCPDRVAAGGPAEKLPAAGARAGSAPARQAGSAPPAQLAAATTASTPRLSGIWEPKTFGFMVSDAPLSKAGKDIVDRNAAAMASGKIMHTAWTSCRPGAISTMTMPREKIVVMQSADEVTLLFEMPRMVRRIRLNGTHPPTLLPSYVGDSVGQWKDGSLVVDTIGYNGFAELDARGQPTSAQLHTVERYTLSADGNSIDIEVTITDPEYYERPFTIKRSWKKSASRHPFEYDCMENPRQEDFENAYYVRDRYLPVCMRIEGQGMALSKVVCGRPKE